MARARQGLYPSFPQANGRPRFLCSTKQLITFWSVSNYLIFIAVLVLASFLLWRGKLSAPGDVVDADGFRAAPLLQTTRARWRLPNSGGALADPMDSCGTAAAFLRG